MVDIKKFSNIDLYGLIGVEFTATENDVSRNQILYAIHEHRIYWLNLFPDTKSIS